MTDTVTLTPEEMDAVDELRQLRSARKDIESRERTLRDEILQYLGGAERALTASGAPAVKIRRQIRRGVDRAALEAKYPDVFEEVSSETEVVILDLS
jgi:hypothetical protein